jgi:apolipoprotein N-acyltransferase
VDGLRSGSAGAEALLPFNWIPLRTHLTSELIGAADILSTAWPFLAMAFAASGSKSISRRQAAVGGGALVFAFVMAVEWVQAFLPGRTPDVTDALVAASAWLLAWYGISGSGRASGPRPVPEDRLPTPAPPPLPRPEPR